MKTNKSNPCAAPDMNRRRFILREKIAAGAVSLSTTLLLYGLLAGRQTWDRLRVGLVPEPNVWWNHPVAWFLSIGLGVYVFFRITVSDR